MIAADATMELRTITDRTLLLALRADLASHAGCAVTAVGADTLDVQELDTGTELRVRAWEHAQRAWGINVRVEFVAGRS